MFGRFLGYILRIPADPHMAHKLAENKQFQKTIINIWESPKNLLKKMGIEFDEQEEQKPNLIKKKVYLLEDQQKTKEEKNNNKIRSKEKQ